MLFNKTTYVDFVSDYGKFIAVSYTTKFKLFGFVVYTIYKEVPTEAFNSSNFVTRQEFDETLSDIKSALNMIVSQQQQAQSQQQSIQEEKPKQINF